jgi:CRP/FNR family transcriptional regulator, anaerobic regulatory protein
MERRLEPQNESLCLADFLMGNLDCRKCVERQGKLFSSVPNEAIVHEAMDVHDYEVPAGQTVLQQGEEADAIYTVREGFLKRWLNLPGGGTRIVRLLRPGDVLGLDAMVQRQYALSAGTLTDTKLCRLPIAAVNRLRVVEPNLASALERRWYGQLARTEHFLTTVASGPSRERVLKLLGYLAEFAHPLPCPRVSRLDMASMLDISSETAARVIAELKDAGLLEESRDELRFDPEQIARVMQSHLKA